MRSVTVETKPWRLVRGVRAPGTGLPGVISLGTFWYARRLDFAVVYRNRPVVRVEPGEDAPFARLLIAVASPEQATVMIAPAVGSLAD